ncbi:hypothetical protein Q1695_007087 [Nippostrongylus brasiliensis]|nr:hypothetical protein Q1695_007087 [Nippostrongylus brasiliensis]
MSKDVNQESARDRGSRERSYVAIITVLNSSSHGYKTALESMTCYAYQNDYKFIVVNNTVYQKLCPQRDFQFFFQRHCIVAHLLATYNYRWMLFVDTDIGVVNEKRTVEEYIRDDADVIFYDRFFNFEIMAGSYLVKKSKFAINFLHGWANFENRLPEKFSGSDNGAIHMYLAEMIAPDSSLIPRCWKLWHDTVNFETLTRYTLCCREVMKNTPPSNVFIYGKGKGWARDAWLSNSHWNPESDFMFHSLKDIYRKEFDEEDESALEDVDFISWINTLRSPLDLEKCRKKTMMWNHEPGLIVSSERLQSHLDERRQAVEKEYRGKLHFIHQ